MVSGVLDEMPTEWIHSLPDIALAPHASVKTQVGMLPRRREMVNPTANRCRLARHSLPLRWVAHKARQLCAYAGVTPHLETMATQASVCLAKQSRRYSNQISACSSRRRNEHGNMQNGTS